MEYSAFLRVLSWPVPRAVCGYNSMQCTLVLWS